MAGYVLGALEKREQQELLSHVRSCVPCLLLAEEHMEVGSQLAGSIPKAEAPPSLRMRTRATLAHSPFHRVRPVAQIHYGHRSGLGCSGVSGTTQRRLWRWCGK